MIQNDDREPARTRLSASDITSQEIDDLIADTERSIANTRAFLERIQQSEAENRHYVESIRDMFEVSLRRLKSRRDVAMSEIARGCEREPQPGF